MTLGRVASVFAVSWLALAGCSGDRPQASEPGSPPAAVRAETVTTLAAAQQTRAVGTLAPRDEIRLAFKLGGVVDRVEVDAGDVVRKGQRLAQLKRAEIDATVAQAVEAAEKAKRDLERGKRLRADEVATEEQVENLTTAYNVARANLDAARFNARYAQIEAPADGIVFERLVEGGELVAPGQPVLVLGSTSSGWVVRVGLADRDIVRVAPGMRANVAFDAYPGREFAGKVTRIGAAADRLTGTFEIEVEVDPAGTHFVRGLVAKVALPLTDSLRAASTATVVPISALVEANGNRATVFVLDGQQETARRKDVTLGPMLGEQIVVSEGLVAGDRVVTDGATWLTDGRKVRVIGSDPG